MSLCPQKSMVSMRRLSDGHSVPAIACGVFRVQPGDETYNSVLSALQLGYRHIDTAAHYRNEESVGKAVLDSAIPREEIFVTTKLNTFMQTYTYNQTLEAIRAQLAKLGMDYVDLYLIHCPRDTANRVDQWRALIEARKLGLAKSIGVSDYELNELQELEAAGLEAPAALQKGLGSGRLAQRPPMERQETETAADQRDQRAQRLERLIGEQTAKLEALKERAALVGADRPEWLHPKEAVAEARRRRDAKRAQQQQQRAALALVSEERRRTSKHIDRLLSAAAATQEREPTDPAEPAEPTEPAAADLPDAPDDLDREIRAMRRREQRLRAAAPRLEEARFGLEKVRNERRDVGRQIREIQAEMNDLDVQLAAKAMQLREMADLARPSPDALRHESETRRLQRAVTELAARRVASEREIARHGQRLERVRCVMSSFLKAQQLPRARPLPEDGTLPAKLAQHVVSLAASVTQLAARKALREATAQARRI